MTPYMENLRREFRSDAALEYANAKADLADIRERLRVLVEQASDTNERLSRVRKEIEEMPPRPSDDESAATDPVAPGSVAEIRRVRARREYQARRELLLAGERKLMDQLSECHKEAAAAEERIKGRIVVAREKVEQRREHTMRRASVYLGGIIDEHRHARILNAHLQSFLSAPGDWLSFSEPADMA
jgi:hypothetical protein